eukprot:4609269-Lingulodinium_polyedra.AAC.1
MSSVATLGAMETLRARAICLYFSLRLVSESKRKQSPSNCTEAPNNCRKWDATSSAFGPAHAKVARFNAMM